MNKPLDRTEKSTLAAVAAACKRHLADSASGPLLAAVELQPILENWDHYKAAADNVTPNQWLSQAICGNAAGRTRGTWARFFGERYEAVTLLGRESIRMFHHELAVWLVGQLGHGRISDIEWARVKKELAVRAKERGVPLSLPEGRRQVHALLKWKSAPRVHVCTRCQELEARLRENGMSAE